MKHNGKHPGAACNRIIASKSTAAIVKRVKAHTVEALREMEKPRGK